MINLSFPKKMRLLTHKDFLFVFTNPSITRTKSFIVLMRANKLKYPRIGLIITKKNIKKSYKRNYVKRLIKEHFRIHQHKIPNMDFVILIKKIKINNYLLTNFLIKTELHDLWYPYLH